jgi:hypothetical protein
MSVNVKTTPKRSATFMIGRIIGSSIAKSRRKKPAPSTSAASGMSRGIAVHPASRMTVANGSMCQACTRITESIARRGSPSHIGAPNGSTSRRRTRTHDSTL